jgi:hypothetical protein
MYCAYVHLRYFMWLVQFESLSKTHDHMFEMYVEHIQTKINNCLHAI